MTPQQRKSSLLLAPFLWLLMLSAIYLLTPETVYAHDCLTDPLNAADCMRTPGFRTIITVGIAVAGTLSAIATDLANQASQAVSRGEKPPEETVYVMNLSEDNFELEVGKSHTVNITTWKVTAAGYDPEPAANIRIYPPPGLEDCLKITIQGSQGTWQATYSLVKPAKVESATSEVAATFPKGAKTGPITLKLPPAPGFVIEPVGTDKIVYSITEKIWRVPPLKCYFNTLLDPGPAKMGFKIAFGSPPIQCDPEIFENYEVSSPDDGITHIITFSVQSSLGLSQHFGPDLGGKNGRIEISTEVVADDKEKTKYTAKTHLTLTPEYRFVVYSYEQDARTPAKKHTYNAIDLAENQFATDGEDELLLATMFVRTDQEIEPGDEYQYAQDVAQIRTTRWDSASDRTELKAELDAESSENPVQVYKVGSNAAVKYSQQRKQAAHRLVFDLEMKPGKPSNLRLQSPLGEYKLQPQYLLLRMWVVPGAFRDTSDALAYLSLEPCRKPLPKKNLQLTVDNGAGVTLSLENSDSVQTTLETDRGSRGGAFIARGTALWSMRYSGLSWSSLPQATFTVNCTLQDKDGHETSLSRAVTVNLLENVNSMLEDMFNDAALRQELNNPYWNSQPGMIEFYRGPLWNICQKFSTTAPYVCYRMRDKIIGWLDKRRHFDQRADSRSQLATMKRMNGIEFDYYASQPAHVWAGFFLSGMGRYGDYAALDPWWGQHWNNPDYKNYNNLKGKWGERARIYGMYAMIAVLAVALIKVLAAYGMAVSLSAAISAIQAWLAGASTVQILALLGISAGADAVSYTADSDFTDSTGRYRSYSPNWPISFIRTISQTEPPAEDL